MSTGRERFNLFTRAGWYNFSLRFRFKDYKLEWKLVAQDTFLPLWCAVVGHDRHLIGEDPPLYACSHCGEYVPGPTVLGL